MALILNIETATEVCSVALALDGECVELMETHAGKSHAEKLTFFIEEVLKNTAIDMQTIDAIAVSKGPGSYTGLRIGVSAAKGLCYALGKPLIVVNTLQAMAYGMVQGEDGESLLCPMIDARRMEVYCAFYNRNNEEVRSTAAEIITEDSFRGILDTKKVLFFGNGSAKCKPMLQAHPHVAFKDDFYPSARYMTTLSERAYSEKYFEDLAYFEPFYLKDFIPGGVSAKIL